MADVTIIVRGETEVVANLRGMPGSIRSHVRRAIQVLIIQMLGTVKNKLTGPVLNVKTGLLRRSVNQRLEEVDQGGQANVSSVIRGTVGTNKRTVPYAAIHEFGGRTRPHVIEAKPGKYLAFRSTAGGFLRGNKDGMVFTKRVNHPGSVMPERSYLRSTLREYEPTARRKISEAVAAGIKARS